MADPADLVAALADDTRLRVFAAVVLGAGTTAAVVRATGGRERQVLQALVGLEASGLVARRDEGWSARPQVLRDAAISLAQPRAYVDHGAADTGSAAVLRVFMPEGRLEQVPAARAKRLVVLDQIARVFEPGVRYPERDVNAMLAAFHADYAALRRYLVDEGFLARDQNEYWRIGGTVEV